LLNSPWSSDRRDNVWLLEVVDAMGFNRHRSELREDLIANYIERQAANDVVQEPIGEPATVRSAIEWERKADARPHGSAVTTFPLSPKRDHDPLIA
jgi:hypothetical protein